MHGARRPTSIKRGPEHANYRHGKQTLAVRIEASRKSKGFHQIVAIGNALGLFSPPARLRGRPPNALNSKRDDLRASEGPD